MVLRHGITPRYLSSIYPQIIVRHSFVCNDINSPKSSIDAALQITGAKSVFNFDVAIGASSTRS